MQKSVENVNKGVDYMSMAADAGDRSAMLYMAKAYETGVGLGENRYRQFPVQISSRIFSSIWSFVLCSKYCNNSFRISNKVCLEKIG